MAGVYPATISSTVKWLHASCLIIISAVSWDSIILLIWQVKHIGIISEAYSERYHVFNWIANAMFDTVYGVFGVLSFGSCYGAVLRRRSAVVRLRWLLPCVAILNGGIVFRSLIEKGAAVAPSLISICLVIGLPLVLILWFYCSKAIVDPLCTNDQMKATQ